MSKKQIVLFLSLSLLLITAGLIFWKFTESPEYIIMTGDSYEKRQVINYIHKKPRWRALRMLRKLLKDDLAEVRLLAAGCAGEYGYTELIPELLNTAENDTDIPVQAQALFRLSQLKAPEAEALIRKAVSENTAPEIRTAALASIPFLEHPGPDLYIPLLKHDDSRIRDKALETAVRLKTAEAVPVLAADLECEELFELPDLLEALQNITGVNRGLDTKAWIAWYREQSPGNH